jgi:hypothetical protein
MWLAISIFWNIVLLIYILLLRKGAKNAIEALEDCSKALKRSHALIEDVNERMLKHTEAKGGLQ